MFSSIPAPIFKLNLEILQLIIRRLDTYSLAAFAQTCRLFHRLVKRELSFETVSWQTLPQLGHDYFSLTLGEQDGVETTYAPPDVYTAPPPVYHPRCMARIGNQLVMPFLTATPVCFIYDISSGAWQRDAQPLSVLHSGFAPIIAPVVSLGKFLYLFGGRQVQSRTLSNDIHVIDTDLWTLGRIDPVQGHAPRPRYDHTVDVLDERYLVVFGGLCTDSPGENDLFLFDTQTNTWIEPRVQGQIPTVRFGHASAVIDRDLYIFGGCQIQTDSTLVHDVLYHLDCNTWTWYKYDHPEAYFYRRRHRRLVSRESIADVDLNEETAMETSLQRDLIIETTGHPPRDRFHCVLYPITPHKLLVLGGHTIRQDRDDNNVLHVQSLRAVDVFNIRHKHWSSVLTSSPLYDISTIYPEDITCFLVDSRNDQYQLLAIGQQKVFMTDSSNESGSSQSLQVPHSSSSPSHARWREQRLPSDVSSSSSSSSSVMVPQRRHIFVESPPRPTVSMRNPHLSRPVADYEGFLESGNLSPSGGDVWSSPPQARQYQARPSVSSVSYDDDTVSGESLLGHPLSSSPRDSNWRLNVSPELHSSRASGSDPPSSKHYTLEHLCMMLFFN